jgi:hypothetical protein
VDSRRNSELEMLFNVYIDFFYFRKPMPGFKWFERLINDQICRRSSSIK